MSHVERKEIDGRNELWLIDEASGATVTIVPARGGIVSEMKAHGREILFLDVGTLNDPSKNVRGGVPILFPSPGKLENDTFLVEGVKYVMKQHGFARELPWKIASDLAIQNAEVTLSLEGMDLTGKFPFQPALAFTFRLTGSTLRIEQKIENRGTSPMPFGVGFHPYFYVPQVDKAGCEIETAATRGFDNTTKREVPFRGFDLTLPEVDMHLLDHGSTKSALTRPGGEKVELRASPEFSHWVVWTLHGKDFVCLEPWTAPGNALNTGDRVLTLAPGESRTLWLEIIAS